VPRLERREGGGQVISSGSEEATVVSDSQRKWEASG
jgi:hypothetical protein